MSKLLPPRPAKEIHACRECDYVSKFCNQDGKRLYVCNILEKLVDPYFIDRNCQLDDWPDCKKCANNWEACGDSPWDEKTPCTSYSPKSSQGVKP